MGCTARSSYYNTHK